jgi:DNA-binding NarL/FixJ family response regulator
MAQSRIRVVVADPAPLNRALARHFLEEDGFEVVGDAARGADLLDLVQRQRPDAIVLDEELAGKGALDIVPPLKEASPDAKIVLLASHPARRHPKGVDETLEKGVGLSNLSPVLRRLCGIGVAAVAGRGQRAPHRLRQVSLHELRARAATEPSDRRLALRMGAVAAVLALLSLVALFLIQEPTSAPRRAVGPPVSTTEGDGAAPSIEGVTYAASALGRLQELLGAIRSGDDALAESLARELMADRAAAIAAGRDVSALDELIASMLGQALARSDFDTVLAMEVIFGPLLPDIQAGPGSGGREPVEQKPQGEEPKEQGPPKEEPPDEEPPDEEPPDEEPPDEEPPDEEPPDEEPPDEEPPAHEPPEVPAGHHYGWRNKPPKGGWHYGWDEHPGKRP